MAGESSIKPRIGISACLLGQEVRYDGGHKRDPFLTETLGPMVEWVPVCPEVEMGLGTPRETLHLVRTPGGIRMTTTRTGIDHTEAMQAWARARLEALEAEGLSGYVLKSDSPSCGMENVKVHEAGKPVRSGRGLFAEALLARMPWLPVEDERRLSDRRLRQEFIERVFAFHRARPQDAQDARAAAVSHAPRHAGPAGGRRVRVIRVGRGGDGPADDVAAAEEPLEVRLHGKPFAVIMRTPGADRELAAGFLLAEGIIRSPADLGAVEHCRHPHHPDVHNIVDVYLLGGAARQLDKLLDQRRNILASASCGLCGRVTIDSLRQQAEPLTGGPVIDRELFATLPGLLRARQSLFDETGGLHGAALFTPDGYCEASAEDVGRHNAVDKVIGTLLLAERVPLADRALVLSGRTSFEIVQKAWMAGVPIVCAVSAPSSLAIELAEEAGITLAGFVRDGGFNLYSHPSRIRGV